MTAGEFAGAVIAGGAVTAPGRAVHEIDALGTILGVWAHPDDEAYLSGGLMALARDAGSRVVCVTATRGELGTPDPDSWPPDRLADERSAELARCLGILGVTEHHWLGFRDGGCASVEPPVDRLAEIIDDVAPDTVLTFGPDGITGHPDHRAVGAWTLAAFDRAARPRTRLLHSAVPARRITRWSAIDDSLGVYLPGFPVPVPEDRLALDLVLDADTAARKVRALAAQRTQTAGLISALGVDCYTEWVREETFVQRR
jgi:LmbE family N-acetylglucosaminyl deacetylase